MRIKSSGMDSAVRQIGDSWSLLIVWSALQGTTRFVDFRNRLGVSGKTLSTRLSKLVDEGILVKRPVHSGARRQKYRVTGKGEALRPTLELMEGWGNGESGNGMRHRAFSGTRPEPFPPYQARLPGRRVRAPRGRSEEGL
jgi:DNA-binding HxlR family transcriptional regulator